MTFHDLGCFHDFPGLENGLTKFHDFPGRVVILMIGHFGDESSQAINYTGTDNEKVTN